MHTCPGKRGCNVIGSNINSAVVVLFSEVQNVRENHYLGSYNCSVANLDQLTLVHVPMNV